MKALMILLTLLFAVPALAETNFSPVQRVAVKYLIEESEGHFDSDMFVDFLRLSKVLTRKELKRFPEIIAHQGFHYVLVNVDDSVYDIAIVVVDKDHEPVNALYIDFSEREQ